MDHLPPSVTKLFNKIKQASTECTVDWNGADLFQVKGPYKDQCLVNLNQKSCSCKNWEISGIPCKHAIAAIHDMADNVNGRDMWAKFECPTTLLPPNVNPKIGKTVTCSLCKASGHNKRGCKANVLSDGGQRATTVPITVPKKTVGRKRYATQPAHVPVSNKEQQSHPSHHGNVAATQGSQASAGLSFKRTKMSPCRLTLEKFKK
ncbi:receptor-like cytoplasmic kinase 176 [Tanacetum coccineum]